MPSQACITAEPAEAAVHDPPSTGQAGKLEIADPDLDFVERQAKHLAADLSQNGIGTGANIGSRGADESLPSGVSSTSALVGTRKASQIPLAMP